MWSVFIANKWEMGENILSSLTSEQAHILQKEIDEAIGYLNREIGNVKKGKLDTQLVDLLEYPISKVKYQNIMRHCGSLLPAAPRVQMTREELLGLIDSIRAEEKVRDTEDVMECMHFLNETMFRQEIKLYDKRVKRRMLQNHHLCTHWNRKKRICSSYGVLFICAPMN